MTTWAKSSNKNKTTITILIITTSVIAILQLLEIFLLQQHMFSGGNRRRDGTWSSPRYWWWGRLLLQSIAWLRHNNLFCKQYRSWSRNDRNRFGDLFCARSRKFGKGKKTEIRWRDPTTGSGGTMREKITVSSVSNKSKSISGCNGRWRLDSGKINLR